MEIVMMIVSNWGMSMILMVKWEVVIQVKQATCSSQEPAPPQLPQVEHRPAMASVLNRSQYLLRLPSPLLELLNRRVRSPDDLLATAGVPVIGVLQPMDSKRPVFRRLSSGRPAFATAQVRPLLVAPGGRV